MTNSRTIPTKNSADLVTFDVKIKGSAISGMYKVALISVKNEANRIPTAKLVIFDGSANEGDFKASNEDLFVPGNDIEILAGYHSDNQLIFKGIIIKHSLKIRQNGASILTIDCKDEFVKMTIGRKSKYFYESKDSEIMENLVGNYSLKIDAETTEKAHPELVQYNVTDWDFMLTRADINGLICICNENEISIKKPNFSQDPALKLEYGATILEFDAEMDARNQYKAVKSRAWDFTNQEVVEVEAATPDVKENGNFSVNELAEVINLEDFVLQNGGQTDETELQAWADAQWQKAQMAKIRGRVKFQGFSAVKVGEIIELAGVGERFNGNVFVSGIAHIIQNGLWTTDAQFGINPDWFTETFEINAPPASGRSAAIQGLQIGIVTQLEGDPDANERILIRLPMIDNAEQGTWARQASLDAGENRGWLFRPEIGDEVIVGFINNDPNEAVVLGMVNSSAKPAPFETKDDNFEKGLITKSEIKVLFDDEKKSITIQTPSGNSLILDEDAGNILIEDQNGNKITLDSAGISIESAKDMNLKATGDVNIEGVNINLKAQAQFKAEGSAGAEVSSAGQAVLKGAMVMIN